jgi:hypothetical protein
MLCTESGMGLCPVVQYLRLREGLLDSEDASS